MYCAHMANQWHLRRTLAKFHPESRQQPNAVSAHWFPRRLRVRPARLSQPPERVPSSD